MYLYCLLGITNSKLDGLVRYYPTYNLRALHLFWFVSKAIVEVEMQTFKLTEVDLNKSDSEKLKDFLK